MRVERLFRERDAAVCFVLPRVLRRVIRAELDLSSPLARIPHRKSWVIGLDRLRWLVAADELGVDGFAQLPNLVILIARPEEGQWGAFDRERLLRYYWELLFHAKIDAHFVIHPPTPARIRQQVHTLGQVAYDEIRAVLKQESMLAEMDDPLKVYTEFVAVFQELHYFASDLLPLYFPGLTDLSAVQQTLSEDCPAAEYLQSTRPEELAVDPTPAPAAVALPVTSEAVAANRQSSRKFQRWMRSADWYAERGNLVRALRLRQRAVLVAPAGMAGAAELGIDTLIGSLTTRLQAALDLSEEELPQWQQMLRKLLAADAEGGFSTNARLLYDLQNVCIDHERESYRVDLIGWIRGLGKVPLKHPLPHLRSVLISRNLRRAAERLPLVRIDQEARIALAHLLHHAANNAERLLRADMTAATTAALTTAGFQTVTPLDEIAREKIVQELLDQVVQRGFITIGDVRDTVSRNQLKLPDLDTLEEFALGDLLLRTDRQLSRTLDGVYQPGPFYLRWLQRLSSLGFGTVSGRFFTRFFGLPFGGAFVIVAGIFFMAKEITHFMHLEPAATIASSESPTGESTSSSTHTPANQDSGTQTSHAEPTSGAEVVPPKDAAVAQAGDPAPPPTRPANEGDAPRDGPAGEAAQVEPPAEPGAAAEGATPHEQSSTTAELIIAAAHHVEEGHEPSAMPVELYYVTFWLGCFLFALLHSQTVRTLTIETCLLLWRSLRLGFIEIPSMIMNWPPVVRLLHSLPMLIVRRYVLSPILLTLLLWQGVPLLGWYPQGNRWVGLAIFVASLIALNSRLGRDTEEVSREYLGQMVYRIRVHLVIGLFNFILDLFKQIMDFIERVLYAVDEHLRFRTGESNLVLGVKAVLGVIWGVLNAVIHVLVTLIIEPTVNPIKHFPVVTVSGKLILPTQPLVTAALLPLVHNDKATANMLFLIILVCVPGVFGFLAWELKENWRLYAANRWERLRGVRIGHHGETLATLLRPGFHSGTIPRLFARQRRAARKRWHRQTALGSTNVFTNQADRFADQLHHEAVAVRHFVERDLLALLNQSRRLSPHPLTVAFPELAFNQIVLRIHEQQQPDRPLVLRFAEQSGWLTVGILDAGWVADLAEPEQRVVENALLGFYQLAAVDVVFEQVERVLNQQALHPRYAFDVSEQGLTVWSERFEQEVHYSLSEKPDSNPRPRAAARAAGLGPLKWNDLVFRGRPVYWTDWFDYWNEEQVQGRPPAALAPGISVLPVPTPVVAAG